MLRTQLIFLAIALNRLAFAFGVPTPGSNYFLKPVSAVGNSTSQIGERSYAALSPLQIRKAWKNIKYRAFLELGGNQEEFMQFDRWAWDAVSS